MVYKELLYLELINEKIGSLSVDCGAEWKKV